MPWIILTRGVTRRACATFTDVPDIGAYVIKRSDGGYVCWFVNRCLPYSSLDPGEDLYNPNDDGTREVSVLLPFDAAGDLFVYSINGEYNSQNVDNGNNSGGTGDPRAGAHYFPELAVTGASQGPWSDGPELRVTLDPAKMLVMVFTGIT